MFVWMTLINECGVTWILGVFFPSLRAGENRKIPISVEKLKEFEMHVYHYGYC